jgi:hypothetical protein
VFVFFLSQNSSGKNQQRKQHEKSYCGLNVEKEKQSKEKCFPFVRSTDREMMDNPTTAASASATLNVTKEMNISFENLSYNAKVGFFKRREFTQTLQL